MELLSQQLDFSATAAPLPAGVTDELYEMCRGISSPDTARQVFETLQPLLRNYRADKNLAIACGLLMEKQRSPMNMGSLWGDLLTLFPEDAMTLRMLMRWYRRDKRTEEGIAHIRALFPDRGTDPAQARNAIPALGELKAWDEIDAVMTSVLSHHPRDRALRMAYIKALSEQSRFAEAAAMAGHVEDRDRMGRASQDLLSMVEAKAGLMRSFGRARTVDVIEDIIMLAGPPRPLRTAENVVFFSGQLGTGGAERQMTRIAGAYHQRVEADGTAGPKPQVWVKHANPATGADFFRPTLEQAGVPTRVLAEEPDVPVAALDGLSEALTGLLELLAPDVQKHTGQLIAAFRDHQTDVAYLWQDGGIVQSALAAVVAGVPRIVTSFRGLPPNLRPHFFRDELPVLYAALARLPHVTFTANSARTAAAYEDWLGLEPGTVVVIPNATPPVLPDGDDSDHAYWAEVLDASEGCTKTVIGVFRFDDNKRPLQWIDAAARYLAGADDTRFVMLGGGHLSEASARRIEEKGLADRVFLAGIRSNVGFYMHRADLLMHLAQMEGLPNVLIEAQLAGTPVLATPAGGSDEVVAHGRTGVLLSDAEVLPEDELDRELAALLGDPDRLTRLGAAALAHSGERFAADTILDRTAELFETPRKKKIA